MKPYRTLVIALACTIPLASASSGQAQHRGRLHRAAHARPVHRHAPAGYAAYPDYGEPAPGYGYGDALNAGAAQVPPRGFYDGYFGPGATVLRRGLAAQYEPGAAQELEPDAKQTATGGPVGGLPGRSGP